MNVYFVRSSSLIQLIISLTVVLFSSNIHSRELMINPDLISSNITSAIEILDAQADSFDISQLRSENIQFRALHRDLLVINENRWLKLNLFNSGTEAIKLQLNIYGRTAYQIDLYSEADSGFPVSTGTAVAFNHRPVSSLTMALPVVFNPGLNQFLLKLTVEEPSQLSFHLADPVKYTSVEIFRIFSSALISGSLILAAIACLIVGWRTHADSYYWLALMIFAVVIEIASDTGFTSAIWSIPYIDINVQHAALLLFASSFFMLHKNLTPESSASQRAVNTVLLLILVILSVMAILPEKVRYLTAIHLTGWLLLTILSITLTILPEKRERPIAIAGGLLLLSQVLDMIAWIGLIDNVRLINLFEVLVTLVAIGILGGSLVLFVRPGKADNYPDHTSEPGSARFLPDLSQSLRLPAAGVLELTDMLAETNLSANQRQILQTLKSTSLEINRKVDTFAVWSQTMTTGQSQRPASSCHLERLTDRVLQPVATEASNKQVEVVRQIKEGVPRLIMVDQEVLSTVLTAILQHCLEYSDKGEILLQITLEPPGRLRFRISDTNTKFSASALNSMLSSQFNTGSGHQILLPIAMRLINYLQGTLKASSDNTKGTTFWFSIPLIAANIQSASKLMTKTPTNIERVLIVQGNTSSRLSAENTLRQMGYEAESCDSAESAMTRLHQRYYIDQPFDLILLDEGSERQNEKQLSERIRLEYPNQNNLVIGLLTTINLRGLESDMKTQHIDFVLRKPLSSADLADELQQYFTPEMT